MCVCVCLNLFTVGWPSSIFHLTCINHGQIRAVRLLQRLMFLSFCLCAALSASVIGDVESKGILMHKY